MSIRGKIKTATKLMNNIFNPLNYSIISQKPLRLTDVFGWHGHIPFAFALTEMLRPKLLVELGTHKGDSYCAFCQAVKALKLDCACYAVDTWEGDEHAGFYPKEILKELRSHHDPLYGSFSKLLEMSFDAAVSRFSGGSIDLLHIDGLHSYDAVKHDFDTWLPKMSKRGAILLHDISVRHQNFGVRKFWDELKEAYPSFEFIHSYGLGVLGIGEELPEDIRAFLSMDKDHADQIRNFFSALGSHAAQKHLPEKSELIKPELSENTDKYNSYLLALAALDDSEEVKRQKSKPFSYQPKISIVVRYCMGEEKGLKCATDSVIRQLYENWELCIVTENAEVSPAIKDYLQKDDRIRHIEGNTNNALSLVSGEFIGFLCYEDELEISALYEIVKRLNDENDLDFVYTDEDKISESGTRFDPHFKPDWSPDTFRSYNYIGKFAVLRKTTADAAGGFREVFEDAQGYDLFLRVAEKARRIAHVPRVLYHARHHAEEEATPNLHDEYAEKALNEHLRRTGLDGDVRAGLFPGSYRVKYRIVDAPNVSVIIPTKDKTNLLKRCVDSILRLSAYKNYKIYIVDNLSQEDETFRYFDEIKQLDQIEILTYNKAFNFSAINNEAVRHADSEYLIFLNNDTEVIASDWIEAMLEFARRRDVGAVGAQLYFPDNTIQHAGLILGLGGIAGYAHYKLPGDHPGYNGRVKIIQNLSAVTAACMMVRKSLFEEMGGFDETYSHAYNDIDLCLRMREKGYLVVYTPYSSLYHHESVSRGHEDTPEKKIRFLKEIRHFQRKWKQVLEYGDPYYNPNLSLFGKGFSIKDVSEIMGKDVLVYDLYKSVWEKDLQLYEKEGQIHHLNTSSWEKDSQLYEKDASLYNLNTALWEKDVRLQDLTTAMGKKDIQIHELNTSFWEKDIQINGKDKKIHELNTALWEKDVQISKKSEEIHNLNTALWEKDVQICKKDEEIHKLNTSVWKKDVLINEKDTQLYDLNAVLWKKDVQIRQKDGQLYDLNAELWETNQQVNKLNAALWEKDTQLYALNVSLKDKEAEIYHLNTAVWEKDTQLYHLNTATWEKDIQIRHLHDAVSEKDRIVHNFLSEKGMSMSREETPGKNKLSELNKASLRFLIVSGIEGAPYIYRCLNLKEQLYYIGYHQVTCKLVHEVNPPVDAQNYEVIILNRPYKLQNITDLTHLCKEKGKILLYSTDDLVTDHAVEDYLRLQKYMSVSQLANFHENVDWTRSLIPSCDACLVSTNYLKSQLDGLHSSIYVIENALSEKQLNKSEKFRIPSLEKKKNRKEIVLGYFSGWRNDHDYDFAFVKDALFEILNTFAQVKLRIVGHLEIDETFAEAFGDRVEQIDFVPFDVLPQFISEVDVNLAPLEPNPHKRSKSSIKFLEAGLLNVPTIASNLEPYNETITHLEDGLLCSDVHDWRDNLRLLVEDAALRQKMGAAAFHKARSQHTTLIRSERLKAVLHEVISKQPEVIPEPPQLEAHEKAEVISRQSLASKYIKGHGIEIGALHNPLPVDKASASVQYVDRKPLDTLKAHYQELEQNVLVQPDIVASAEDLSVIPDAAQDFLIANHLLEHAANPVQAMKEFHRVVKKYTGIIYLALPNMRNESAFDKDREVTPVEHFANDYLAKESDRKLIDFNHFWEWVVKVGKRQTFEDAFAEAKKLYDMEFAIHYHVFVEDNFLSMLDFMRDKLNIKFEILEKYADAYEFIFILKPVY